MTAASDLRVGICAIAKDEGSSLEEWVAYHHLQGYGPIRVYAHECRDNSHAVLARLAKYGLCEWAPFVSPPRRKPQPVAYQDGIDALRSRTDWLAFVDLDEFLVTPRHASIQAFLAEYGRLGAIAVNCKVFAGAGRAKREPGLVIERFTRCAAPHSSASHAIRMLARTDTIDVPRAHTAQFRAGTVYQTVLGESIGEHVTRSRRVSHDVIRVNHYAADFDHDDEIDTEILRWAEPLKALVATLRDVDLDAVYGELDAARRRVRQLEAETTRLADQLRFATARSDSVHAALQAETRRNEALEQRLERITDTMSWRVGSRAVRVARMAKRRGAGDGPALDVTAPTPAERPAPDAG